MPVIPIVDASGATVGELDTEADGVELLAEAVQQIAGTNVAFRLYRQGDGRYVRTGFRNDDVYDPAGDFASVFQAVGFTHVAGAATAERLAPLQAEYAQAIERATSRDIDVACNQALMVVPYLSVFTDSAKLGQAPPDLFGSLYQFARVVCQCDVLLPACHWASHDPPARIGGFIDDNMHSVVLQLVRMFAAVVSEAGNALAPRDPGDAPDEFWRKLADGIKQKLPDLDAATVASVGKTLKIERLQAIEAIEHKRAGEPNPEPAKDPSAYVLASTLWPKHGFESYNAFKAFLKSYGVDNYPDGQRRWVHAAQCLNAIGERDRKAEEAEEIAGAMLEGVKERTEAERKESLRRKREEK